jgi:hypothetical protein
MPLTARASFKEACTSSGNYLLRIRRMRHTSVLTAAVAALVFSSVAAANERKPNILIIMVTPSRFQYQRL